NSNFKPIILSISLGVSTKNDRSNNLNTVLKDAEDRMYTHKLVEGKSARSTIISSLQKTLFERSSETEAHAKRMLVLASEFGSKINLTQYEMDEMQLLTLLHDVGKIGIADNILNKPDILSHEEWYEMRKHPEIGYRIAQSTSELSHIADLILTHHERWDGNGYPQGLKGESIPKLSRILSIIDTYDVMTHHRPYNEPVSEKEALDEISRCSGTQFDPKLAEIFVKLRMIKGGSIVDSFR
ncbi:MAG TPA: HD domain-containing phosphohydrolase, partial [Clostridia bacterium]|nr:HD domain-containing phosphohydrolase [Clostridia bacterium]